ncbi:hypothetical protein BKA70DRAFT_480650 [Coprinopsis sp. MPI-PUGE-AT-0042]|nr:hypothetical protein BKA70DRAFT_480650 [Coprinopsis sp. MPI-PUGE-AT-0042]
MPKDLPGFYWDSEKSRYFPLSSRPAAATNTSSLPGSTSSIPSAGTRSSKSRSSRAVDDPDGEPLGPPRGLKRRRGHSNVFSLNQRIISSSWNWAETERLRRCITSQNVMSTTKVSRWDVPTFGRITAFCTFPGETRDPWSGDRWKIVGDNMGWLMRSNTSQGVLLPEQENGVQQSSWLPWSTELNLQPSGTISSISMSGSRWVATGSGNAPRIVFSDIRQLDHMCIITLPKVRDLWASHLRGQQLVLGGQPKALYLPDLDHSSSPSFLHTDADIFCVTQDEHLIYTGSRHGTVHRFDKRVGFHRKGQVLLEGRYGNQVAPQAGSRSHMYRRTPALKLTLTAESNLARTLESGLLVSQMNGDLQLFDLRRLSSSVNEPAVRFVGHNNSYRKDLGMTVDLENDFIYAAGQDRRIRAWRLSTGEPLEPSPQPSLSSQNHSTSLHKSNPFFATFEDPVEVLQVTPAVYQKPEVEGRDDQEHTGVTPDGMCLWATSGRTLWRWNLGQRDLTITSSSPVRSILR